MKSYILALVTTLALAGTAAAEDVASIDLAASAENAEAGVHESHTITFRLFTDAAGTPMIEILVDGAPIPGAVALPAPGGVPALPGAPGLPEIPTVPGGAPALPSPSLPAPRLPALPTLP